MPRIDELPDDPVLLKRLLAERDVLIERIKEEAADRLEEQAERIKNEAVEQLEALRQRMEAEKKAAKPAKAAAKGNGKAAAKSNGHAKPKAAAKLAKAKAAAKESETIVNDLD